MPENIIGQRLRKNEKLYVKIIKYSETKPKLSFPKNIIIKNLNYINITLYS